MFIDVQIAFHSVISIDGFTDLQHFGVGQVLHAAAMIDAQLVSDLLRRGGTDTVNVGERDNNALVGGDIYPGNTSHLNLLLHRGKGFLLEAPLSHSVDTFS
jgi:hypothetical protein